MDLSIIIVNYNRFNLTEKCIDSVKETVCELDYEIIVVDNNSSNNSYIYLKDKYENLENVTIIKNSINEGFGAANNLGVNYAEANFLLFLNPDVIVLKDAVKTMFDRLKNDETIGLEACKLLNEDKSLQFSCRRFIKFYDFLLCRTPFKKMVKKNRVNNLEANYLMKDYDHKSETYVDWVMGSCMMIKKEVFLCVGGFSKEYFMYFEDVDLCYKLNKSGKKILYYPKAEMIHLHKQESVKKINKLTFTHLISMVKFYIKFNNRNSFIMEDY